MNYSFSSKEVRTDTENSASNSNTSSIPTNTTTTANDDSNLFLASYWELKAIVDQQWNKID